MICSSECWSVWTSIVVSPSLDGVQSGKLLLWLLSRALRKYHQVTYIINKAFLTLVPLKRVTKDEHNCHGASLQIIINENEYTCGNKACISSCVVPHDVTLPKTIIKCLLMTIETWKRMKNSRHIRIPSTILLRNNAEYFLKKLYNLKTSVS